jgi:hypothetical protein
MFPVNVVGDADIVVSAPHVDVFGVEDGVILYRAVVDFQHE